MPAKAVDAGKRFDRNHRFRGHGPLLQVHDPTPTSPSATAPYNRPRTPAASNISCTSPVITAR